MIFQNPVPKTDSSPAWQVTCSFFPSSRCGSPSMFNQLATAPDVSSLSSILNSRVCAVPDSPGTLHSIASIGWPETNPLISRRMSNLEQALSMWCKNMLESCGSPVAGSRIDFKFFASFMGSTWTGNATMLQYEASFDVHGLWSLHWAPPLQGSVKDSELVSCSWA